MSNVFVISDLHIGHKRILEFSSQWRGGKTIDEHDEWIVDQWNSVVNKKDKVFVLGDVCFDLKKLCFLDRMKGRKDLILGNHDQFKISEYQKYFQNIHGITKYRGTWLSHVPVHPDNLRRLPNIHGHMHDKSVRIGDRLDTRYANVSVELVGGIPARFETVKSALWMENGD